MDLENLIKVLKDRPGIDMGRKDRCTLDNYGMFIQGFLIGKERTPFEETFLKEFPEFVRSKLDVNLTKFEFWFETITDRTQDEEEAQYVFFALYEDFKLMRGEYLERSDLSNTFSKTV